MKGVYKSVLVLVLSLVLLAVSFSCVAAADISVEDVSVSDVSVDIGGDVDVVPQVSGVANDEINSMESNVANLKGSNTVYVGKNITANGNGTRDNPYNNLKLAMDQKPAETIIQEGVYGGPENTVDLKGIVRAEDGANVIINGSNMAKSYIILRGATLKNLTFINFNAAAVLYLYEGNNTIEDCTFINNTGTNVACIDIEPGNNPNANIKNCTFINNHGMPSYVASVNKTYYNAAGAIYVGASNSGFPVVISDCTFINTSADDGGAIYWNGIDGSVSGCTFTNSSASAYGGAIYWNNASGSVSGCTFTNINAHTGGTIIWEGANGKISDSNFNNSNASEDAGAIYWNSMRGNVSDCNFTNTNTIRNGGAIYWLTDYGNISGCNFLNSTANVGGAIYWDNSKFCNVTDSIFTNCSATLGPAMYIHYASDLSINNCSNTPKDNDFKAPIYNNGTINITNSTVENNTAGGNGGGIDNNGTITFIITFFTYFIF